MPNNLDEMIAKLEDAEKDRQIKSLMMKIRQDVGDVGAQIYSVRAALRSREREQREAAAKNRRPAVEKSLTRRPDADRFYRIAAALINADCLPVLHQFGRQEVRSGRLQPAV